MYDAFLLRRRGVRAIDLSVACDEAIFLDDHRVPGPYVVQAYGAPGTRWTVVSCTCVEKHDYNIVNFKLPFIINRARNSLRRKRGARLESNGRL